MPSESSQRPLSATVLRAKRTEVDLRPGTLPGAPAWPLACQLLRDRLLPCVAHPQGQACGNRTECPLLPTVATPTTYVFLPKPSSLHGASV